MSKKTRKAQVVICGYDAHSQSLNYLLLQTNQKRGEFWQNVTGKVDAGETYEEGALREVIEETNLNPQYIVHFIDLKLSHNFIDERNRDVHEKAYLLLVDRVFDVKIDPHEHMNHRWERNLEHFVVKHEGNFEALVKAENLLREEYT